MRLTGSATPTPHPLPVNPPTPARHPHPEERLAGSSAGMVVEGGSAFVETAGVPGVGEAEAVKIKVVAEFVAQRIEEGSAATEASQAAAAGLT